MKGFSQRSTLQNFLPWISAIILVILLIILGIFQYRWLHQVAEANRVRTHAALSSAVERFASDFNGELTRLLVGVRGGRLGRDRDDVPAFLTESLETWRETSSFPDLVVASWMVGADGVFRLNAEGTDWEALAEGESVPPKLVELTQRLKEILEQPAALSALRRNSFRGGGRRQDSDRRSEEDESRRTPRESEDRPREEAREPRFSSFDMLSAEVPALTMPLLMGGPERGGREGRGFRRPRRGFPPGFVAFLILELDSEVIFEEVLPTLADRHFGDGLNFHLAVQPLDASDNEPLFSWGPGELDVSVAAEAEAELFGPLIQMGGEESRMRRFLPQVEWAEGLYKGRWRLIATHPEGSLDRVLERARHRNMAVALGILLVLSAALLLLARNASRSRRLARQQLDFVAGITHEIMTPVAALRSAGQNLADGVVTEASQVTRYGRMIDREGRRLGELVGQVLAFARMQSERPRFNRESLPAEQVVEGALEMSRAQWEEQRVEIEVHVDEDLPPLFSDPQAAIRSLANLIGNAVKYGQPTDRGSDSGWIGLRVSRRGSMIGFEVKDRGPGIGARERTQIFEPFFRGGDHAAGAVPGSGLGLALVKHLVENQGGRVAVASKNGQGTTFTIYFPISRQERS